MNIITKSRLACTHASPPSFPAQAGNPLETQDRYGILHHGYSAFAEYDEPGKYPGNLGFGYNNLPRIFFFLLALTISCGTARAGDAPVLSPPLDCRLDETCWIVNYVDTDPAKDMAKDFTCGPRTYDDHDGTDFAIADQVKMESGVAVFAAAPGTVRRVRDEIDDKTPTEDDIKTMLTARKGCGNGILIDHGNGWETIYCHMKRGSVSVKPGEEVKTGDRIGLVGQSGAAEFPHLHIAVFHEGRIVDPFTGFGREAPCGTENQHPLWRKDSGIDYAPVSLYAAGFREGVPDFDAIKIDSASPDKIAASAPALVFWAEFFGAREGDAIRMEILGPDGRPFAERDIVQERTRARQFYYLGRPASADGLPPGLYRGRLTLTRPAPDGAAPLEREITHIVRVD